MSSRIDLMVWMSLLRTLAAVAVFGFLVFIFGAVVVAISSPSLDVALTSLRARWWTFCWKING